MKRHCTFGGFVFTLALAASVSAQPLFDFSEVTRLAAGALVGQNVERPVRGFELMLLKDGRVVYHRSFGAWAIDRPANADSATKTLSGALIMSLVDSSPLPFSLDTRLSEYIPAFAGEKSGMTIRQCFSHTAGTGQTGAEGNRDVNLQEAALLIAAQPLAFAPGAVFSYGGTSMHAAGAVAELAGQRSFNTLFADRITSPLGLGVTRFVLTTPDNPRVAGGCESNAREFSRFMEMLRRGGEIDGVRVLSAEAVDEMFTRQTAAGITVANSPYNGSADYGVGVWLDERDAEGRLIGALAAGARGFSSWIDFDDGIVGTFSTDVTQSQNVRVLIDLIRLATAEAVRHPRECAADFNGDGFLDYFDLIEFVDAFEAGYPEADVNADGFLDFFDYDTFVGSFEGGC
jgi:CubicO group peptidase (beta-lactamase class C family)